MSGLTITWSDTGSVTSVRAGERELLHAQTSLFTLSLLDRSGARVILSQSQARSVTRTGDGFVYAGFPVPVSVTVGGVRENALTISVENHTDSLVEWTEFPRLCCGPLAKNGGEGAILFPYNEGALVDDIALRESGPFRRYEPVYPSGGSYAMFPNMVFAQFLCYMAGDSGLYIGQHDALRGPKAIDFMPENGGVTLYCRAFSGGDYGESHDRGYASVLKAFTGSWYDGADIYRDYLEADLPIGLTRARENTLLPQWYHEPLVVVSYPVRGIHDMDKMDPNALFPYSNALPMIDEIAEKTGSRILVLLMHWEGTAPWAPPYVWPPYGGEDVFRDFMDRLHESGHLLGVYCSGFGFTKHSNLIDDYDNTDRIDREDLYRAFCASERNTKEISHICTGQRSGYDLCVASETAKKILDEAYRPLLVSGVDYAQILDQNHGGGQYLCYSRDHGHAPCPGAWMTREMQELLASWQAIGGKMLLGCESSAAEPFLPYLLMSDCRYELNYHIGSPVPLFAYLYHEYLHNFMGNQVSLGLDGQTTLLYRLAWSFSIGDVMTLVTTPDGRLMRSWGDHDFNALPDRDEALDFIGRLIAFQKQNLLPFFSGGRMLRPEPYTARRVSYPRVNGTLFETVSVLSTAWEADGKRIQLFVNPCDTDETVTFRGTTLTVPARDAAMTGL